LKILNIIGNEPKEVSKRILKSFGRINVVDIGIFTYFSR
jgi:hypothetical protein